jgi:hypothetical protein
MPINGKWFNPALGRCYRKRRYPNWGLAEMAAKAATRDTGELIIAYQCLDCQKYHIGHADQCQIIIRQPEEQPKPVPTTPVSLPFVCPRCSNAIPEERRRAAEQTGTPTVYCSRKCQQKACKKARHLRRNERLGRTPDFFERMREP